MNKIFSILLFFLLLPCVLAVEFDVNENFSQGETIIAKISGNFISPITNENIVFYREHVSIPMDYSVSKVEEDYYLYANTVGKSSGDYSVSIENIQYMQGGEISEEKIVKNFSITNETAEFSVSPGFAVVSGNFFIEVQNLQDKEIILEVDTNQNSSEAREIFILPDSSRKSSFELKSGETKKINFELGAGQPAKNIIKFSAENLTYNVPIYMYTSFEETQIKSFGFDPPIFALSVQVNKTEKKTVYIFNTGTEDIEDISLSLSDSLKSFVEVSPLSIKNLDSKSGVPVELTFLSRTEKKVDGLINAVSENETVSLLVSISFLNTFTPTNQSTTTSTKTCAEYKGTVCSENYECDKEPIYAKDNVCCLGTCSEVKSGSSGKIIGAILLIIVVAGLVYFYKKYKKAKKTVNLLEIARGKLRQ